MRLPWWWQKLAALLSLVGTLQPERTVVYSISETAEAQKLGGELPLVQICLSDLMSSLAVDSDGLCMIKSCS